MSGKKTNRSARGGSKHPAPPVNAAVKGNSSRGTTIQSECDAVTVAFAHNANVVKRALQLADAKEAAAKATEVARGSSRDFTGPAPPRSKRVADGDGGGSALHVDDDEEREVEDLGGGGGIGGK